MTFANQRLQQLQHAANETAAHAAVLSAPETGQPFQSRFQFDPEQVMASLRTQLVGQEHVMEQLYDMLQVLKADFSVTEKPLAVLMLLGPTGVGKTETVRIISQAISGHSDAFCRIDMNTLAQEHYAAALTGAPPGYVGSKEGNTLFDVAAIEGSFSKPGIVLFDEIEKASDEVIRALLNVLDTGHLRLTAGTKTINFRNCLIFMTSNIGAKQSQQRQHYLGRLPKCVQQLCTLLQCDAQAVTDKALRRKFDPEFLNRIDGILHYKHIGHEQLHGLIEIELNKLQQRLQKQQRYCQFDPSVYPYLATDYDSHYGARGLARRIRMQLEPRLARFILQHPEKTSLRLSYHDQKIQITAY